MLFWGEIIYLHNGKRGGLAEASPWLDKRSETWASFSLIRSASSIRKGARAEGPDSRGWSVWRTEQCRALKTAASAPSVQLSESGGELEAEGKGMRPSGGRGTGLGSIVGLLGSGEGPL